MLCGTRWLAEFQRRVGKDRSSRRERHKGRGSERERERGKHKEREKKGIKDEEVLDKITLKGRQ